MTEPLAVPSLPTPPDAPPPSRGDQHAAFRVTVIARHSKGAADKTMAALYDLLNANGWRDAHGKVLRASDGADPDTIVYRLDCWLRERGPTRDVDAYTRAFVTEHWDPAWVPLVSIVAEPGK
jgi:hypothetical protein